VISAAARFYLESELRLVGTAGETVGVRVFGQGPALVFLHGFPLHGFTFRQLLPELSSRHTCYVIDLLGAGESRWSNQTDFSFPAQARAVRHVLRALGVGKYALLAHDTGASVARHLALLDAERVTRLVLINTEVPGHRPPWIPLYGKLLALPGSSWVFQTLLRSRAYLRSSAGFGGCFVNRSLIDGEFRQHFIDPLLCSRRRVVGYGRYLCGFDWHENDALAERHASIGAPVLFVWGADDRTFPEPFGRKLAKQFPNCVGFQVVPGAKLLPHEERPDAVLQHVIPFLRPELNGPT
jgi:haloalkane dehalogenase